MWNGGWEAVLNSNKSTTGSVGRYDHLHLLSALRHWVLERTNFGVSSGLMSQLYDGEYRLYLYLPIQKMVAYLRFHHLRLGLKELHK